MASDAVITAHPQPRLFDIVREWLRVKYYSLCTEDTSVGWIKRFILFHNKHHPIELGERDTPLSWRTWLLRSMS